MGGAEHSCMPGMVMGDSSISLNKRLLLEPVCSKKGYEWKLGVFFTTHIASPELVVLDSRFGSVPTSCGVLSLSFNLSKPCLTCQLHRVV